MVAHEIKIQLLQAFCEFKIYNDLDKEIYINF